MPTALRFESPQANRASRTTTRTIGTSFTGVATTDLFTLVGGVLDTLEDNALVRIAGVLTGGAGLTVGSKEYYLLRVSSTTFRLSELLRGPAVNFTSDVTSTTQSLTYGLRDADSGRVDDIVTTVA